MTNLHPLSKLEEELIKARSRRLIKRLHFLTIQSHVVAFTLTEPLTPKQASALKDYIHNNYENIQTVHAYGTSVEIHVI